MENYFYNYKTKKNIRGSLLLIYSITAGFYWLVYSCSTEFNEFGYFFLNMRGHLSKFTGQGAITTIIFSKYVASLFLIISSYYTISAILSLKNRTMYVPGTDREYINCPVCNESLIIKGQAQVICDKCKAVGEDFVLQFVIKQDSSKKVDNLKTSSLISLTVAFKSSLIVALFID